MVCIDFVNHLRPRRVEFLQYIFKNFWWDTAFNKKSENINSYDFRIIFALSTNVPMRKRYVIAQQYFKKFFKNNVMFERYD